MWNWFWNMLMANDSQIFDPQRIRHGDVAYELRDLSHRAVFYFFLALAVVIFLVALVLWGVFRQLGGSQYAGHQTTNPIMTSNEELKPIGGDPVNSFPAPHLQPDPVADLNKFRIREEQWLNTYGWMDQAHARIHIPIETAIDMMAASWPQDQEQRSGAEQGPAGESTQAAPGEKPAEERMTDDRRGNYGW
jgi:hypothetical protein